MAAAVARSGRGGTPAAAGRVASRRPATHAALLERVTELLKAVLRFAQPSDAEVSSFLRRHPELGPRERHALAETVYTVLRLRPRLQHLAQSGSGPLERRLAIAAWQGDERALQGALREPEQTWLAHVRAVDVASLPEPLHHNLPEWIATALKSQLDPASFEALAAALLDPAPLDLRVNTLVASRDEVREALATQGHAATDTPYSPWGLRLRGRPAVNRLELFRRGAFEVQDEGSQLLALLTEARRGEMVVDFCAGAGGKTLALGAMMRSSGRLYAFDTSGHRLHALRERMARGRLSNVHPVQIAHERDERVKRLAGKIDRVLVDAPCSGLGTLRRNPDLKWRQTPQAVAEMAVRQAAILEAASRLVKPGGRLIYATCSLLAAENERVASGFEQANPAFRSIDAGAILEHQRVAHASTLSEGGRLRLWPHRHATDGFFAAVWQRNP